MRRITYHAISFFAIFARQHRPFRSALPNSIAPNNTGNEPFSRAAGIELTIQRARALSYLQSNSRFQAVIYETNHSGVEAMKSMMRSATDVDHRSTKLPTISTVNTTWKSSIECCRRMAYTCASSCSRNMVPTGLSQR